VLGFTDAFGLPDVSGMIASDRDPIVAIATAPGRGGIGVVRISGGAQSDLLPLLSALIGARSAQVQPRRATTATFVDADGGAIDQGLVLLFPAPRSYTGETVLELHGHGGPVVLQMLVARCLEAARGIDALRDLRLAQPGEFTRRAFLNDRLDLAQAEAVADLIDASTAAAVRSANRSLAGAFSREVHALADAVIELRTLVEATLDFPEEEIDFLQAADARGRLAGIRAQLETLLKRAQQGALLREGLNVVLVGAPNVGKSSLLNALAGEEVAIVTPIAGTTRDRIAQTVQVHGIPLHIIDTAGLRETADEVERIGIARTLTEVARADVVLHLVDATHPAADAHALSQVRARVTAGVPLLTVRNKIDLTQEAAGVAADARVEIRVSALTGAGLDALQAALLRVAGWEADTRGETVFMARERQLEALRRAQAHLADAAARADVEHGYGNAQLELFAEELRLAASALAEITGEFSADDLLGRIFSRFCIGK
jgi:tRNA modification GTPase